MAKTAKHAIEETGCPEKTEAVFHMQNFSSFYRAMPKAASPHGTGESIQNEENLMNHRELKESIKNDPNLTGQEKVQKLKELREPYRHMTDEELLQLVRDFTEENGREPMRSDVLYDGELKTRFGPWPRMLEKAGTRPVAQSYIDRRERRKEKRIRHKEYRRQIREQQAQESTTHKA